jgi:hypothetical protein
MRPLLVTLALGTGRPPLPLTAAAGLVSGAFAGGASGFAAADSAGAAGTGTRNRFGPGPRSASGVSGSNADRGAGRGLTGCEGVSTPSEGPAPGLSGNGSSACANLVPLPALPEVGFPTAADTRITGCRLFATGRERRRIARTLQGLRDEPRPSVEPLGRHCIGEVFGGCGQRVLPGRRRGTHGGVTQRRDDLIIRIPVKEVIREGRRIHAARQPQTLFFFLKKILSGSR